MTGTPVSSHGGGLPSQWTVDSHGALTIQTDQAGGDVLIAEGSTGYGLFATIGAALDWETSSDAALLKAAGPTAYFQVGQTRGLYFLALNAAPADAAIAAGGCALWLDATNGVGNTKLMVKAKSADGTVKTAAIVLT